MSRPRHYSQAAEAKRQQPEDIAEPLDDDEQFEWYDLDDDEGETQ